MPLPKGLKFEERIAPPSPRRAHSIELSTTRIYRGLVRFVAARRSQAMAFAAPTSIARRGRPCVCFIVSVSTRTVRFPHVHSSRRDATQTVLCIGDSVQVQRIHACAISAHMIDHPRKIAARPEKTYSMRTRCLPFVIELSVPAAIHSSCPQPTGPAEFDLRDETGNCTLVRVRELRCDIHGDIIDAAA